MPVPSLTQIKLRLSNVVDANQAEVRPCFQAWFVSATKYSLNQRNIVC